MNNLDLKTILAKLIKLLKTSKQYAVFAFVLCLLVIYAFLGWRISVLSSAAPSADQTQQSTNAHVVKVDPELLSKIQQLQDNSVSVQALFSPDRSNPFQQ
jgi:hypothetical protein